MSTIEVVAEEAGFRGLRSEWDDLLARSNLDSIFLTWEWLYTWWQVFGAGGELQIITVRDDQNRLTGIAPLFLRRSSYYGVSLRLMAFVGTGLSDRQSFIVGGSDPGTVRELLKGIARCGERWDVLLLSQVPCDDVLASRGLWGSFSSALEEESQCPFVTIDGEWQAYLRTLSKKFRGDIRNKVNRAARLGTMEVSFDSPREPTSLMIESMAAVERASKKGETEKALLADDRSKDFLAKFCALAAANGWLDFAALHLNNSLAAYLLGFTYHERYYAYNMAYVEDTYAISPGKILLHEKIKWCFENGSRIREFDFLRGGTYIKSLWSTDTRRHCKIVVFRDTFFLNAIRHAVFTIRPIIKRLLGSRTSIAARTGR